MVYLARKARLCANSQQRRWRTTGVAWRSRKLSRAHVEWGSGQGRADLVKSGAEGVHLAGQGAETASTGECRYTGTVRERESGEIEHSGTNLQFPKIPGTVL